MWYHGDLSWGGWVLMSVGMVAFWALVAALVVYLVRSTDRTGPTPEPPPRSPEQVLGDRFARGEIDEVEYLDRLEVVRTTGRPAHSRQEESELSAAPDGRGDELRHRRLH